MKRSSVFKKFIAVLTSIVVVFSVLSVSINSAYMESFAANSGQDIKSEPIVTSVPDPELPAGSLFISSSPESLAGEGNVVVSIVVNNLNEPVSVTPSHDPSTSPEPGDEMSPTPSHDAGREINASEHKAGSDPKITPQPGTTTPGPVTPSPGPTIVPTDTPTPTEWPSIEPTPEGTPYVPPTVIMDYIDVTVSNSYHADFGSPVHLPAGGSITLTAELHVKEKMIGVPLTFTVSWKQYFNGEWRSVSHDLTLLITRANTAYMSVSRVMDKASAVTGEEVVFTYTLVNTGSIKLNNIRLIDKAITGSDPMVAPFSLASGESFVFVYTYTMGKGSVVSEPVAYFTPEGSTEELRVSASKRTLGILHAQLSKEVLVGASTPEGVKYTLYLTNNGNCMLNNLVVTDDLGNRLTGAFNLAIGETKIIEYNAPNPDKLRYVVFYITGENEGVVFRDNTVSYPLLPYVDPSTLGIDFRVAIEQQLTASNYVVLRFYIRNYGSISYETVTIVEPNLDITVWDYQHLSPSTGENDFYSVPCTLYTGGERELLFQLTATDISGNSLRYDITLNAFYGEDIVPGNETPQPADPNVVEDPQLGEKLESLITDYSPNGERLKSVRSVFTTIIIISSIAIVGLIIAEVVIRVAISKQNKKNSGNKPVEVKSDK